MKFERSKEWWLEKIANEPDCPIEVGVPDYRAVPAGYFGRIFLRVRARCGVVWRVGLISRYTAFRWDMDAALGEWSVRA